MEGGGPPPPPPPQGGFRPPGFPGGLASGIMRPPAVLPQQTRYFNQPGGMPQHPVGMASGQVQVPRPPPVPVLSEQQQQQLLEEKVMLSS